ncbi:hypothetical protein CRG98_023111 [Punica granatum]|uniref:Uncharacterized protein n=1 Tax=Punica granatum TaxID=22663 RepID=A0A2I0JKI4_PUNGR|nr:hypothetical protein CRG98_023111 [Punica granatum]
MVEEANPHSKGTRGIRPIPKGNQPNAPRPNRQWQLEENEVATTTPTAARCKIGLLGLLRDEPRRSWTFPNVPRPGQTRNSERKLSKKLTGPGKKEEVERRLCTIEGLSDRDHLFTGESEGNLNEPNITILRVNECSGDLAPREPVLPRLDDQGEVVRPRCSIAPACIVSSASCFPNAPRRSETAMVLVCQEGAPKTCREAFVTIETSLGRSACSA